MSGMFNFQVVAPTGILFTTNVQFVVVPGREGQLGILPNHAPLITALAPGVVYYTIEDNVKMMAIAGGFMDVADNSVTILSEAAELAEHIDPERANEDKIRAEKRLQRKQANLDISRANLALYWAEASLKTYEQSGRNS